MVIVVSVSVMTTLLGSVAADLVCPSGVPLLNSSACAALCVFDQLCGQNCDSWSTDRACCMGNQSANCLNGGELRNQCFCATGGLKAGGVFIVILFVVVLLVGILAALYMIR
mmetsp:Transcript_453/g.836  ORF Transcript_453/g.836 Transcript_453/m.836 type:complete len:112 (-) Transcript_453:3693-4028(-)